MNSVVLMGRLSRDVDMRTSGDMKIARFNLAVDRRGKDKGADFIDCVAFGKTAEFAEKYLQKGTKIAIDGRIQTSSYEKDGKKYYSTDVVVNSCEFAESKKNTVNPEATTPEDDGFLNIPPEAIDELPFK